MNTVATYPLPDATGQRILVFIGRWLKGRRRDQPADLPPEPAPTYSPRMAKAVVIDPRFPPKEVLMDETFDEHALIGCESLGCMTPSYLVIFSDPGLASYRSRYGIPNTFDPDLCMVFDDDYLRNRRPLNKICSDLYSACRARPWVVLGTAALLHCSLEQLKVMYDFVPRYLARDTRIKDQYKKIILSRDASAYDEVLDHLEDYR